MIIETALLLVIVALCGYIHLLRKQLRFYKDTGDFQKAYWKACKSSKPLDWLQAALAAQRILKTFDPNPGELK